jgi:hypothetical protein
MNEEQRAKWREGLEKSRKKGERDASIGLLILFVIILLSDPLSRFACQ